MSAKCGRRPRRHCRMWDVGFESTVKRVLRLGFKVWGRRDLWNLKLSVTHWQMVVIVRTKFVWHGGGGKGCQDFMRLI